LVRWNARAWVLHAAAAAAAAVYQRTQALSCGCCCGSCLHPGMTGFIAVKEEGSGAIHMVAYEK
jgi:hypothetical protein